MSDNKNMAKRRTITREDEIIGNLYGTLVAIKTIIEIERKASGIANLNHKAWIELSKEIDETLKNCQ